MFISEMPSNSRSAARLPWASAYCITLSFSAAVYERREELTVNAITDSTWENSRKQSGAGVVESKREVVKT